MFIICGHRSAAGLTIQVDCGYAYGIDEVGCHQQLLFIGSGHCPVAGLPSKVDYFYHCFMWTKLRSMNCFDTLSV